MDYTPWFFKKLRENKIKRNGPWVMDDGLPPCTFGIPLMDWANNATVRE